MTMTAPVASEADFYLPAGRFFPANLPSALTYDDVSLATLYSEILPKDADLATSLSDALKLQIPVISSDMDTVTESRMAIAMALNGGIGLIHYNLPAKDQIREIARVKRHIHGLIQDPITVTPESTVGDVLHLIEQRRFEFRTFPVVERSGKLIGLLPGSTVRERYRAKKVAEAMVPRSEIRTVHESALQPDPIKAAVTYAQGVPLDLFQRTVISTCSISALALTDSAPIPPAHETRLARPPKCNIFHLQVLAQKLLFPLTTISGRSKR